MPDEPTPTVYTVVEAAKYLRVHRRTIGRLIRDGQLPAFRIGGQWRIRAVDLHALLEPNRAAR